MKFIPKPIKEEVNVTPVHPLVNFGHLLTTVVAIAVVAYVGLGFLAEYLITRISPEQEVELGQRLLPGSLTGQQVTNRRCLQYLETLLSALHTPANTEQIPLAIHIWPHQEMNAAILPGGTVLVSTGLLQKVESENELAFVLAHEYGHFVARDPLRALGRSLVFMLIMSALGLGSGESKGASGLVSATGQLAELNYSRQQELEADRFALAAIMARYQHGGHSLDFFEKVLEHQDGFNPDYPVSEYFSTHPLTQNRLTSLRQVAAENNWSLEGTITPVSEALRQCY